MDLTIGERYRLAINRFRSLRNLPIRKDSTEFQTKLLSLLKEFQLIKLIINQLALFSENESIKEVNTNYIPFFNVDFYIGNLFQDSFVNNSIPNIIDPLEYKVENLKSAKQSLVDYLQLLESYKILSKHQELKLGAYSNDKRANIMDIPSSNPVSKRQEKIENFKLEQELKKKLTILDEYYDKADKVEEKEKQEEDSIFEKFDEDIVKQIYLDQITLFTIHAFNNLESITMELGVLSNRKPSLPKPHNEQQQKSRSDKNDDDDEFGFTTRLETVPFSKPDINQLISKQGKILQPFTITSNRQKLKDKVFGTGQVLPSMTVEEYLDYELANGKMMKEEVKDSNKNDDDTDNSDDELEKRRWDDWKDDHPKGAGNMKANIG
ncbi:TAP42-like protein [Scheffersomyces amazonensis]|uniref:TAP42-like protein n=1 Tax=Scheffersomyces amazonensis TaxID=1078765 RepID=UPI00315D9C72